MIRSPLTSKPLALLACLVFLGSTHQPPAGFDAYHSYAELTQALRDITNAHPDLVGLVSAGRTEEGRDIWLLEVGNRSGKALDERPALLIAANFEGNQVVGSEMSLQILRYLTDNYASDEDVRQRLDNTVIYIFPRVNPDGAERMFAAVQTGTKANTTPGDDDNDGRTDEDGPDDLNADGFITVMRVADPSGDYMIDPDDERLMKKADPKKGESGAFTIYLEGLDDDSDGFYNEDGRGGVNLNRNFQHAYPYYTPDAGPHMVSELESRALMDFVVDHRNIGLIYIFGENDNLITAPNNKGELGPAKGVDLFDFAAASNDEARSVGAFSQPRPSFLFFRRGQQQQPQQSSRPSGRKPATAVNRADLEYFTTISKKYKELTGIEKAPALAKPAGAFFEYGYYQFGVPSFSTPGWGLDMEEEADTTGGEGLENRRPDGAGAGRTGAAGASAGRAGSPQSSGGGGSSLDNDLIKWMDANAVDGFVDWAPVDHPTLGEVEIGGFKPYEAFNPPYSVIDELGPKHGAFVVYLASLFADVRIAETEVTDHGGGIFRIKVEVENAGFLPTSTAHGVTSRSVRPTMVQLGIDPEDLISGDAKTSFFQATDGSGARRSFEWIVKGNRGDRIDLKVVSQKGGTDSARLTLQ